MDRKRSKRMSNENWVNPHDREAEIARLKDGRTAVAHKAEQAVEHGHGRHCGGDHAWPSGGRYQSILETVPEAAEAVAEQIVETDVDIQGSKRWWPTRAITAMRCCKR